VCVHLTIPGPFASSLMRASGNHAKMVELAKRSKTLGSACVPLDTAACIVRKSPNDQK
jgi:hypothetical protein